MTNLNPVRCVVAFHWKPALIFYTAKLRLAICGALLKIGTPSPAPCNCQRVSCGVGSVGIGTTAPETVIVGGTVTAQIRMSFVPQESVVLENGRCAMFLKEDDYKSHEFSVEQLFHFKCGVCRMWWTISDWSGTVAVTCPHCGKKLDTKEVRDGRFT